MDHLKTYEGFFDFLKRKDKTPVDISDVTECLYDISDEQRIKSQLNRDKLDGVFASNNVVFKYKPSLGIENEYDDFMDLYTDERFTVRHNNISFKFTYNKDDISDGEVNQLLMDCKNRLQIYKCEMSFFIMFSLNISENWHFYKCDNFEDFIEMINKSKDYSVIRNVTVKITSTNGFI